MIVLLPHCGFLSETSRMLHIAQALRAQGEAVCLATHGGPYARVLADAGVPCTMLRPHFDDARCAAYLRDLVRIGKPGTRLQPAPEVRESVRAEVEFLRACGARAVVTGFTLTTYLSSRVAGIPLVTSHGGSYVPPLFERGLAPVPTTMPMPGAEWLPAWLKRRIANGGAMRLTGPTRFLNEIASELGVEPVPTLAALMLGDLTLVTDTAEVLGIPDAELEAWQPRTTKAYRAGTRLVATGPLFAHLDLPVPPEVERFLDGSRPTALVVLSSSTPQMLRQATARVRAAGVRVIVGATLHEHGRHDDPDIVVAGLLPNHLVMPRVDVAVTMGGQGTVQTAMASGTPLVGIPLHPEQELNVDLAARHGAALAVAPRHVDTPRLTEAVRRVLADRSYAAGAAKVRGWYAGRDGAAEAASAIRRWLVAGATRSTGAPAARPQQEPVPARAA
ncbi:MAG: glycosyltransferase family 1 protein [Rubrivivax sp.]|nr:glycosyltransferase family 1 protein [Rubrivivax sp.]